MKLLLLWNLLFVQARSSLCVCNWVSCVNVLPDQFPGSVGCNRPLQRRWEQWIPASGWPAHPPSKSVLCTVVSRSHFLVVPSWINQVFFGSLAFKPLAVLFSEGYLQGSVFVHLQTNECRSSTQPAGKHLSKGIQYRLLCTDWTVKCLLCSKGG